MSHQFSQICRVDYEMKAAIQDETEKKILDYIRDFSKNYSIVILQDYDKGVVTERLARDVIDTLKQQGLFVLVDPAFGVSPKRYRGANLLKPNRKEAEAMVRQLGFSLSSFPSPESQAKILLEELELGFIVVTLGLMG